MSINRHNYEEFFILYLDNELSAEQRAEVDSFVKSHPDLAKELFMLQQSKLIPDNDLVYDSKEALMMIPGQSSISINTDNYQEWLLLYIDNELSGADKKEIEKFLSQHPAIKEELTVLQKTISQPEEAIVFGNKESLYRKEEKERRVIAFRWQQLAVAAILLFVVGTSIFLVLNKKETGDKPTIAAIGGDTQKVNTPVIVTDPKQQTKQGADPVIPTRIDNPIADATNKQTSNDQSSVTVKQLKINDKHIIKTNSTTVKPSEVVVIADPNNPNNIPDTRYTPNMQGNVVSSNEFAKPLTNLKGNNSAPDVTLASLTTLDNTVPPVDGIDQPEKKNKLRGLLRKVTRTFEKATNIKATDENDRLLVGGLAIQL